MKVTMAAEYVSTRDAAALLGNPLQYSAVHYLARRGLLQRIEVSPRRMFYQRAAVVKIAARLAPFQTRAG